MTVSAKNTSPARLFEAFDVVSFFVVHKEPSFAVQMNREFPKMKKQILTYQRAQLKGLSHELYWEFDYIYI
jgi:hypothetical protein